MTLLYRVIYAAHANGSHHKLALDALTHLVSPEADGWRRLFLKYADVYLKGSKAPDTEFKDFRNHVLHVGQGYWGGAVDQSRVWYSNLVQALGSGSWAEAVYSAGVLSHYVVDPMHPFHTAQSENENAIHRAVEWSIAKSYDALKTLPSDPEDAPPAAGGSDWLAQIVKAGAERSHRHYDTLIAHYDFAKGIEDPPAGLDAVARSAIAGLISYAAKSFALVLDRAFEEAGAAPPHVAVSVETVLAVLQVPQKWVLNKIADVSERRQVAAIYAELQTTGRVATTLPEESRVVRETFAREAEALAKQRQVSQRLQQIPRAAQPYVSEPDAALSPLAAQAPAPAPSPAPPPSAAVPAPPARDALPRPPQAPKLVAVERGPRIVGGDPVEAAPSIGHKTAERLARAGVATVADLVSADADALASRLAASHIDANVVLAWQDQARLALALPNLNGTNAQLLVAVGYRTLERLRNADPAIVHEAMAQLSVTPDGGRIVRDGKLPSAAEIKRWIEVAQRGAVRVA